MTLIDGDRIVTSQLYDDEHEEFTEKKMSIIEIIDAYTTEGVTVADDVFGKIRERIELEKLGYPPSAGYYKAIMKCLQIIDKYREPKG